MNLICQSLFIVCGNSRINRKKCYIVAVILPRNNLKNL